MISYGRQTINEDDINAVEEVLRSDWLTQGPLVPEFEAAVAARVSASHAVAANSATSALHMACLALGLGHGDLLWTSPISFVASANCALYCGADVDFVDIDPASYNISVEQLDLKLQVAENKGCLPKVLVVVHMCGQSADMQEIGCLAKRYGVRIIEDASHAIGGTYLDNPIGNCDYSDIAVFSFHPVKIITTGEGGMAMTNDARLASAMRMLRSHGITRDPSMMLSEPDGDWYYEQRLLGFNYRMSDIQAALGLSQLKRLDAFIARRIAIAEFYASMLTDSPVRCPELSDGRSSSWHLYVVRLPEGRLNVSRATVFDRMRTAGIGVNVHYIPIHLQPFYRQRGFSKGDFPQAEQYYQEALTLPLHPTLSYAEQQFVVDSLKSIIRS